MRGAILVAGASGRLGRRIVSELSVRGAEVVPLARRGGKGAIVGDAHDIEWLERAMQGIDAVVSCLGASVIPLPRYGRETFSMVDAPANKNLIKAAERAGVPKLLYVSVFASNRLKRFDFVKAHEQVAEALRASSLDYRIVKPTGFFGSLEEILFEANFGMFPEHGSGEALTNPIHEADLAEFCADALEHPEERSEWDVGGPDILSRREISEMARESRLNRSIRVPAGVLRVGSWAYAGWNPRVSDLLAFIHSILSTDLVAPCYGSRRLSDYFASRGLVG